jgi:methionyl-tRNA formyltransferase
MVNLRPYNTSIMTKHRIVFMGTPDFAAHCLQTLIDQNFNVVGVVTVADKPAGRGQQIQESAVKKVALANELPILQPLKLKDEGFLTDLQALKADLFVVIAFRMLPEVVWQMPPLGCINLHGSLLPQFRGAAPINHAIMAGDLESGVTTFFIEQEIDKGNILLQARTPISENETAGELHDRLMQIGANLVCETLNGVFQGTLKAKPQAEFDLKNLKHAPKIFKADCEIDWQKPAQEVHNKVRGLSPYPAAWTTLLMPEKKTAKIFKTLKTGKKINQDFGEVLTENNQLFIACADEFLEITELQLEGKRRVATDEFLRGLRSDLAISTKQ